MVDFYQHVHVQLLYSYWLCCTSRIVKLHGPVHTFPLSTKANIPLGLTLPDTARINFWKWPFSTVIVSNYYYQVYQWGFSVRKCSSLQELRGSDLLDSILLGYHISSDDWAAFTCKPCTDTEPLYAHSTFKMVVSYCSYFWLCVFLITNFIFLIPTQQNAQLYIQRVHITSRKLPWTIARVYVSTIGSKIADSLCNVCAFTQPYKWEIDSPGTRKMTYMASTHLEPFLWESALYNYVGIRNLSPNREFLVMRNTHNRRGCFLVLSKVECVALLAWPLHDNRAQTFIVSFNLYEC